MKKAILPLLVLSLGLVSCNSTTSNSSTSSNSQASSTSSSTQQPTSSNQDLKSWDEETLSLMKVCLLNQEIPYLDLGIEFNAVGDEETNLFILGSTTKGSKQELLDPCLDIFLENNYEDVTSNYSDVPEGLYLLKTTINDVKLEMEIALSTSLIDSNNYLPEQLAIDEGYLYINILAQEALTSFPSEQLSYYIASNLGRQINIPQIGSNNNISEYEIGLFYGSFGIYSVGLTCYTSSVQTDLNNYIDVLTNNNYIYDSYYDCYLSQDKTNIIFLTKDENSFTIFIESNYFKDNGVYLCNGFFTNAELANLINIIFQIDINENNLNIPIPSQKLTTNSNFYIAAINYGEYSSYMLDIYIPTSDTKAAENYNNLLASDSNWGYDSNSKYYINNNGLAIKASYDNINNYLDIFIEPSAAILV